MEAVMTELPAPSEAQEFMRQLRRDHPGKTDAWLVAYVARMEHFYRHGDLRMAPALPDEET